MKKTLLVFAATTALWAAIIGELIFTNTLYVLTKNDVVALENAFGELYARGYQMYLLYDKCKNSI